MEIYNDVIKRSDKEKDKIEARMILVEGYNKITNILAGKEEDDVIMMDFPF